MITSPSDYAARANIMWASTQTLNSWICHDLNSVVSLGDSIRGKEGKLAQMGRKVFRFAENQRYSLCRKDLSQFFQARLPPCLPFGFAVLWFRVVLRDLHKFDVNASNLKRPAKVAARKGKINLTAAPKRRRVFMIEFGVKRRKHNPKHSKNPSMRW